MSRHLTFLLLTYACLVVQTGAGEALAWGDWRAHLAAAPVAAAVLLFDGPAAILWAAVVGLWWDGLSGGPLGESLFLMAGIAKLLQWSLGGQPVRSSAAIGLLVGATAWLHGLSCACWKRGATPRRSRRRRFYGWRRSRRCGPDC